jgi:hypothetical protein
MNTAESQIAPAPAPPSLIKALMGGFDAIASHFSLTLFPVVLDLFLWFGPRLRLYQLIQSIFDQTGNLPGMNEAEMTEMMRTSRDVWLEVMQRFNLLSVLRTFPVGIPSLMSGRSPLQSPLGAAQMVEIRSAPMVIGLWLLCIMIGLVAGVLYFDMVAQAALSQKLDWRQALLRWPWASAQVLLLSLAWVALLLAISIPFSCMLSFLVVTGFGVARLAILIFVCILAWLLLPLVFSPHGIFVYGHNIWISIKEGIQLTRLTFPTTSLFFLSVLILSEGLDVLWQTPPENSWFSMIGVIGHAFVTTGLLAATFVYYADADRWSHRLIQQTTLKRV